MNTILYILYTYIYIIYKCFKEFYFKEFYYKENVFNFIYWNSDNFYLKDN